MSSQKWALGFILHIIVCITTVAVALSFYQLRFLHANPKGVNGAIFVE